MSKNSFHNKKMHCKATPDLRRQRRRAKIQDRRSILEPESGFEIEDDY